MATNNLGREKLSWSQEFWNQIDQSVHDECQRTKIAAKFLPLYPAPGQKTIPSDRVELDANGLLSVDQTKITPLIEIWVEFSLTAEQVESGDTAAVTIARNAANALSKAEDILIFQGQDAIKTEALFTKKRVQWRDGPAGSGLLKNAQIIQVKPVEVIDPGDPTQNRYGENTFGSVAKGYSLLQKNYYGHYALVLPTNPFADTWAPLKSTLIAPADRIKGLILEHFYGSSALPDFTQDGAGGFPKDSHTDGILVALDGNTVDLVIGRDAVTAFTQIDGEGRYRFRVFERFALRLKDPKAVVRLEFQKGA